MITVKKIILRSIALVCLVAIFPLLLIPFIPYAMIRGLVNGNYLEDWNDHVMSFVDYVMTKFKKK